MPCRGPDEYDTSPSEYLKAEVHKLTRLLCYVLYHLPECSRDTLLNNKEELKQWWEEHKKTDLIRKIREYSKQYPNFNEDEIRKMINSGILK